MSDITLALAQAGVLLFIGHRFASRLLLWAAVVAVAIATAAIGFPESRDRAWDAWSADLVGAAVGALLGIGAIRARETRAGTTLHQRKLLSAASEAARSRARRRRRTTGLVLAALTGVLAGATYLERERVDAWRHAFDAWLFAPAATVQSASRTVPQASSPAAGRAGTGSVTAANGQAGAPARRPPSAAATRVPASDDAAPGTGASHAGHPPGDLRHCLEMASQADVLRCADRRR